MITYLSYRYRSPQAGGKLNKAITYIGNTDKKGKLTTIVEQKSDGTIMETLVVQSQTNDEITLRDGDPKTRTLQIKKKTKGTIEVARAVLVKPGRTPMTHTFVIELKKPDGKKGQTKSKG